MTLSTTPARSWDGTMQRWLESERLFASPANPISALVQSELRQAWLAKPNDPAAAKNAVLRLAASMDELRAVLAKLSERIERDVQLVAREEQFGSAWQEQRAQELATAFARSPAIALRDWQRDFADALAAWRLDACEWLIGQLRPHRPELAIRFARAGAGVATHAPSEVVAVLDELTARDGPLWEASSGPTRRRLLVLKARVLMQRLYDFYGAEAALELAGDAASSATSALVQTAWSELHRMLARLDDAQVAFQAAIATGAAGPDAYVARGAIAAEEENWEEADRWFGEAIDQLRDEPSPLAALRRLHAPVHARMLWKAAQQLQSLDPFSAAEALELAGDASIASEAADPRGEILEARALARTESGNRAGAAADFRVAGERYVGGDAAAAAKAAELFERARDLEPEHQETYWRWADALYVASYRPEPPFADESTLAKAAAAWDSGRAHGGVPRGTPTWPYLTRAVICERQALASSTRFQEFLWEAVRWVECNVLLDPHDERGWATLCRLHRALSHEQCALDASENAVAARPSDVDSLEERVIALVNSREYERAEAAIATCRESGGSGKWLDAVEAHILLHRSEHAGEETLHRALDLSAAATDQKWFWGWRDRARILVRLNRLQDAAAWWDQMIDQCASALAPDRPDLLLAYVMRDRAEKALEVLRLIELEATAPPGELDRLHGLVLMARGDADDVDEGSKLLQRGVSVGDAKHIKDFLLGPATDVLAKIAAGGPAVERQRAALAASMESARTALAKLPTGDTALDEVTRRLAATRQAANPPSERLGALATAGRLHRSQGAYAAALRCYVELLESCGAPWDRAIDLVIGAWLETAHGAGGSEETVARTVLASCAELGKHSESSLVPAHLTLAIGEHRADDDRLRHLRRALEALAASSAADPAADFVRRASRFLTTTAAVWTLDADLQRIAADSKGAAARIAEPARQALTAHVNRILGMVTEHPTRYELRVTPLRLYLHADRSDDHLVDELAERWPAVQDRVRASTGLQLPDLVLQSVSDSDFPHDYVIAFRGVAAVGGTIDHEGDAVQAVLAHVETTVRVLGAEALGIVDAALWLERARGAGGDAAALCRRIAADPQDVARLAWLMRALAVEAVPLAQPAVIAQTFDTLRADTFDTLVSRTRLALRDVLPGNDSRTAKRPLSADLETELSAWNVSERGRAFLAFPAEEAQPLLRRLGSALELDDGARDRAAVVNDPELRAPVHRVLAAYYTNVPVLSHEELGQHADGTVRAPTGSST